MSQLNDFQPEMLDDKQTDLEPDRRVEWSKHLRDPSINGTRQWHRLIFEIYRRMRVRAAKGAYEVECDGINLTVMPGVYSPIFFTDSLWFAKEVRKIVGKATLLEIGTGTAVIAAHCAYNGAHVVATDVNPEAVCNAQLNVARHRLPISIRKGSLYDPIGVNETFDFIFWAHPFNNWNIPVTDMLLRSGMDYRYEGLSGYIAGARKHLTPTGRLLLGTGSSADLGTIAAEASANHYCLRLLKETHTTLEIDGREMIQYYIFELVCD